MLYNRIPRVGALRGTISPQIVIQTAHSHPSEGLVSIANGKRPRASRAYSVSHSHPPS